MSHIHIGSCPSCGHALKAREHAPRTQMHVTCRCGWHGNVEVDRNLVAHAEQLREQGIGRRHRKTRWQRFIQRIGQLWPRSTAKHSS